MAVRKDNIPPRSAGSITQKADADIDRIGNISNVSKTVSNMQKDVKQRLSDTQRSIDESQSISMVQKSMSAVLDKLAGTVDALSKGVKTITIDTAKATKDTITQFGKSMNEDIGLNKTNIIAMSLAKATPLYGYFAAKFMETDVFKKAAERMKTSIGKVFGSVAGLFSRGRKGKGNVDADIPKMARGGYVKKGGIAELHAGEMVAPIEKILKRIDDSISTTKDLAKITEKTSLHLATDLKGYIKSSTSSDKSNMNVFRSAIRTWKEVSERAFTEQPVERMARSLLAIQDILGAQIGTWKQVQDEMLTNHPTLVKMKLAFGLMSGALTAPYKIARAFFKVRGWGGYRAKLSKAKNPLQASAENIASLYVDLMWRLDNMLPLIKLTAQASRDTASKLTGNKYPRIPGVPKEKNWSASKVYSKVIGTLPGMATSMIGQSLGGLGGLLGKGKGKLGSFGRGMKGIGGGIDTAGQWLMEGGGEVGRNKRLKEMSIGAIPGGGKKGEQGATSGPAMWVTDTNVNKVALDYQEWVKYEASQISMEKKLKLIEYKTVEDKYKHLKADRVNALWGVKASKEQVSTLGKLRKTLAGNKWLKWLFIIGGFLKTALMSVFGPVFSSIATMLGISVAGRAIGGGSGILGGLLNIFGKGGSADKTLGPAGSATKLFGKGGNVAKFFGKGGGALKAIKGIGSVLASPAFFGVMAAAGVGIGIGTWLNDSFVTPFLDKLDKDIAERRALSEKNLAEFQKQLRKDVLSKDVDTSFAASRKKQLTNVSRGKLGEARMKAFDERGLGLGDANISAIQTAQQKYIKENPNEYLKYSQEEIDYWRLDFIENVALNRSWFKDPEKYGMEREAEFLKYLQRRGTPITNEQLAKEKQEYMKRNAQHFGLVDPNNPDYTKKPGVAAPKPQKPVSVDSAYKWSSENEKMRERHQNPGWIEEYKKGKEYIEQKAIQTVMKGKGIGTGWWNKLDAKSKAAFKEAKQYYMTKGGLSEAEADAQIQSLVSNINDTYGIITNPETYKNYAKFGKDVYAGAKDKLPAMMDSGKIVFNNAAVTLAPTKEAITAFAQETAKQTKELSDVAIKEGSKTGAVLVNAVTNNVNNLRKSSVVQSGMGSIREGGTAAMDYWNNLVYRQGGV